jgi:hypothetical protein
MQTVVHKEGFTQFIVPTAAMPARATRHDESSYNALAYRENARPRTNGFHCSRNFMAQHTRRRKSDIAMHYMQVGMAHTTGCGTNKYFTSLRCGVAQFFNSELSAYFFQNCSAHGDSCLKV